MRHKAVEPFLKLPDDQHRALGLDGLIRLVQQFARPQLFQHVLDLRERQAGVFGLAALAQRV